MRDAVTVQSAITLLTYCKETKRKERNRLFHDLLAGVKGTGASIYGFKNCTDAYRKNEYFFTILRLQ